MSSPASSVKGEKAVEEDAESYDEDVEYLERGDCAKRLRGLLIRVAFSLFFIGACSGALVWSFVNREKGANQRTVHSETNFTVWCNEYTKKEGSYSVTYRLPDDQNDNSLAEPEVYQSWWYQDNINQRLVHRRDNQTTVYLFSSYAYFVDYDRHNNIKDCRYDKTTNYQLYIYRLGLANVTREHSAYEKTTHHEKVWIYNGDPSEVILEGTQQDSFLVTVYADATYGALLGWDTYFTASANSSVVYLISYWYDNMYLQNEPPPSEYFDPPAECEPNV